MRAPGKSGSRRSPVSKLASASSGRPSSCSKAPRLSQSGAEAGLSVERAVEAFQRLVGQAGVDQDIGAVAVGVGEIGVERDRLGRSS